MDIRTLTQFAASLPLIQYELAKLEGFRPEMLRMSADLLNAWEHESAMLKASRLFEEARAMEEHFQKTALMVPPMKHSYLASGTTMSMREPIFRVPEAPSGRYLDSAVGDDGDLTPRRTIVRPVVKRPIGFAPFK